VFYRLVQDADVFASNIREQALKRLGVEYETLSRINPRIVYAIGSGYGPKGPDHDLPAMDILAQARGGLMSVTGEPGGPPGRAGFPIADHVAAICLGFGIVSALLHRERTGEGQRVDGSLLAGQLCVQSFNITSTLFHPEHVPARQRRGGPSPTWNVYAGSDGKWFVIGMNQQKFWPRICAAIERPELASDERYSTIQARLAHFDELVGLLEETFRARPAAEWVQMFSDADLMAAPVNDYADVATDPQVVANGYTQEVELGHGLTPVRMIALPLTFSKTPAHIRSMGPEFGQNTEDVLLEAGYTWEEIGSLNVDGVIGLPRAAMEAV
jgi:crotonobetainyl-CoA:carnitine CoA-transferase CaiB-like acyl-CoA transferase